MAQSSGEAGLEPVGTIPPIASPLLRLGGALCDSLLFLAVVFPLTLFRWDTDGSLWWRTGPEVAMCVYGVVCVAVWGRTVGKWFVGTRVVDRATGSRPGWAAATARVLLPAAVAVVGEIGGYYRPIERLAWIVVYVPILWDPLRRGLHDRLAGTLVVND